MRSFFNKKRGGFMIFKRCVTTLLILFLFGFQGVYAIEARDLKNKDAAESDELLTRIDFGNSYVTGQALKSGAIYLLQRKKNQVKSMLTYREDYRKEILESHDIRKTGEKPDKSGKTDSKP
jgi:hypothetical protein